MCASTMCPFANCTLNMVPGSTATILPSISIVSEVAFAGSGFTEELGVKTSIYAAYSRRRKRHRFLQGKNVLGVRRKPVRLGDKFVSYGLPNRGPAVKESAFRRFNHG